METPAVKPMKTSELWAAAHSALCEGRWSIARRHLDDLGQREDNRDCLSSALFYGVPQELYTLIQDRIDLVNSNARKG